MLEIRDPAIKLFGMTIPVAGDESPPESGDNTDSSEPQESDKELAEEGSVEAEWPEDPSPSSKEESTIPPSISETDENKKESDCENQNQKLPCSEKDSDEMEENDSKNSEQKPMKKPDKIIPCPRCNSMDTKFCYYNNYNVNQPRHFCKSCQRYWTAGGTMRNVPVGAGRRKSKSSASRYVQITVSEALQAARLDGVHRPNGKVINFGSDRPLCESMASGLNIADKKALNGNTRNGFHSINHVVQVPCNGRENGDERSSGSTVTTTGSIENVVKNGPQEPNEQTTLNGFSTQMPCFQWPLMWNPGVTPVPTFCPSGFSIPFYPAPYWNGAIPWNVPWIPQCSPEQKSPGSNPSSPILGKHSREGEMLHPNEGEKSSGTSTVLVPKTLRIDDPDEAAKSSIWSTLGIQKEKCDPTSKGGFFNSFQSSKLKEKEQKMAEVSPELKANPAALCRSVDFQERF